MTIAVLNRERVDEFYCERFDLPYYVNVLLNDLVNINYDMPMQHSSVVSLE